MASKVRVLFLCNGNSCRSKIAEAWTRKLFPDIEAFSAGLNPHPLNPYVLTVMEEKGIDLSGSLPQNAADFSNSNIDFVITVCDKTSESCHVQFNGAEILHQHFDGPSKIARTKNTEEEKLDCYRLVRDEIYDFIKTLPVRLKLEYSSSL